MNKPAFTFLMLLMTIAIQTHAQTADTVIASDLYEGRSDIVARRCVKLTPGFHSVYGSVTHAYTDSISPPPQIGYIPTPGDLTSTGEYPTVKMNYIKTTTMRAPVTDESLVGQTARTVEIEYIGSYGAPLATLLVKGSPNKKDIVTNTVRFDIGNRIEREYLPFESENGDGSFPVDILNQAYHFYHDTLLTGCDPDSQPWRTPLYDGSLLDRITGERGAGDSWQGHETHVGYKCNATSISLWRAGSNNSWPSVTYPAGSLFYESHTDEDGFETRSYTDNRGRVVLEQSMGGQGAALRTAYVYDDLGRIRCVVPPKASSPMDTCLCYHYVYNGNGDVVEKRLPGRDKELFVYDKHRRTVMSQDANLRVKGEWAFTMYDAFGRTVLTGYLSTNLDRQQLQSLFETQAVADEEWSSYGPLYGYPGTSFPSVLGITRDQVSTANWYDCYGFLGLFPSGYSCPGYPTGGTVAYDQRTKGTNTGYLEKVYHAEGSVSLLHVFYYDTMGRPVCTVNDNHLGGQTDSFVRYNFSGQPTEELTVHAAHGHDTLKTRSRYTYDHAGRCLQEFYRIGDTCEILAKAYEYNEVGNLLNVYLHSADTGLRFNQKLRRHYNIRGWLTRVNDFQDPGYDLLAYRLTYNTPLLSLSDQARFNGKVSQAHSNGRYSVPFAYGYYYDEHDRLYESHYAEGAGLHQGMDDCFEDYGYDPNGNLTYLGRKRDGEYIDILMYNYGGTDRVTSVNDLTQSSDGYRYNSGTYAYDGNGNTAFDPSRHLDIVYDRLNYPKRVIASSTDHIEYLYSSGGDKLRKKMTTFATPGGLTTDYSGEFVYEDGDLSYVVTPFGRAVPSTTADEPGWRYCYYLKDHLGNVRAEFAGHDCGQPELLQQADFYPSGYTLRRNDYGVRNRNRRLFGGKELQDETLAGITLNLYDFEARTYDPTIGRFLSVDPLSEKYYGLSPYSYCGNDPVNAVDPHGDSISITYNTAFGKNTLIYNNGELFNSDKSVYDGEMSGFLLQSVCALNTISRCDAGYDLISELQTSTNMFTIEEVLEIGFLEGKHNKAYAKKIQSNPELYKKYLRYGEDLRGGSPGTVNWNPEGRLLPTTKGDLRNGTMDLAHELSHALDSNRGLLDSEEEQGIPRSEWQAVCRENIIRKQLNYPLRTHYKTSEDPSGTYRGGSGVRVLTEKNQPIVPYWYKL